MVMASEKITTTSGVPGNGPVNCVGKLKWDPTITNPMFVDLVDLLRCYQCKKLSYNVHNLSKCDHVLCTDCKNGITARKCPVCKVTTTEVKKDLAYENLVKDIRMLNQQYLKISFADKNSNNKVTSKTRPETEVKQSQVQEPKESIVKGPQGGEIQVQEAKEQESSRKEPTFKTPRVKETRSKESRIKESDVKEPEVKEPEVKDPEVKEPEVKEPKVKESKTKEPRMRGSPLKETISKRLKPKESVEEPITKRSKVKESSVEEPITKRSKAKESPVKEPKLKRTKLTESPVKEPKSKGSKVKESPVREQNPKRSKVKESLVEEPISKRSKTKESPVKESKASGSKVKELSVEEPRPKRSKVKESPVKEMNSKRLRVKESSAEEANSKRSRIKESSIEESKSKETKIKESPVKEPRPKRTKLTESPIKESKVKESKMKESPVKESDISFDDTVSLASPSKSKGKKLIASTLLSEDQKKTLDKFSKVLNVKVTSEFPKTVTHLVTKSDANKRAIRSMKYMKALLTNKWIVSFDWITQSLEAGELIDEEPFEILGTTKQPKIQLGAPNRSRISRDKLFADLIFYFDGKFKAPDLPRLDDLRDLVTSGGGTIINFRRLNTSLKKNEKVVIVKDEIKEDDKTSGNGKVINTTEFLNVLTAFNIDPLIN